MKLLTTLLVRACICGREGRETETRLSLARGGDGTGGRRSWRAREEELPLVSDSESYSANPK